MTPRMQRRAFMAALGGAAAPWMLRPRATYAQHPAMPVIGFLDSRSPDALTDRLRGLRQGLKDTGLSRARTSPSSTAGRRINSIGCRRWQTNWSADRSL
jgi:hypothetical protein